MDATERKTLMAVMFVAGCLLLAPRQWVSAGILLVPCIVWFTVTVVKNRRARRRAPPPPPLPLWVLTLALSIIGASPALVGCGPPAMPPSAPSPLLSKPVPAFKKQTLTHGEIDSTALRGKTLVVKFFAEYCEPCKRTLPAVEALARGRQDVAFVGINEDERASTASDMVAAYGLSFPVIHDANNALAGRFRVTEMPATFVVGPTGEVAWVGGPDQPEADLETAIDAVSR